MTRSTFAAPLEAGVSPIRRIYYGRTLTETYRNSSSSEFLAADRRTEEIDITGRHPSRRECLSRVSVDLRIYFGAARRVYSRMNGRFD
jgi:hypothetical protein